MSESGGIDFLALEAGDYLDRLDALLAEGTASRSPDAAAVSRTARALRGAATMARQPALAELAGAMESAATTRGSDQSAREWSPALTDALTAAADAFRSLLRSTRHWDDAAAKLATERTEELRALATDTRSGARRPATVVPIARLFGDGPGPHVIHANPQPRITADQRFRQAAVPLAATLRRLIGEARGATDDGARRSAGDDLRAALRDLGELAESYDIAAVANFARVREPGLVALDARALDVVDGAARALVDSAGATWTRRTPAASLGVVAPPHDPVPPPEDALPGADDSVPAPDDAGAAVAPPAGDPGGSPAAPATSAAPVTPVATPSAVPTGQALVALLESSITGLHGLGTDDVFAAASSTSAESPASAPSDGVVPIESLLYRGRSALDRARAIGAYLRGVEVADQALLAELWDLLELAAADEPTRA